jgi:hypothetical protein
VVQYESGNGSVGIAGEGHDSWAKECVFFKGLERGGRLTGQLKHEAGMAHQDRRGNLQVVAPIVAAKGGQFSSLWSVSGQHEITIAGWTRNMHSTRMARRRRNKFERSDASRTAGAPGVHRTQIEIGIVSEETMANPFAVADRDAQIAWITVARTGVG